MDQKQTEGVGMKSLDPTTPITLTQITQTHTQTDKGGVTLWRQRPEPSTSPTAILLRFSPPSLLAHPTLPPPRLESLSESSESAHRHMCLLWRFTTSGPGPSRSPRRPATNTVKNTETEKEKGNATENESATETENESATETGRGRATGFLRGA